MLKSEFKNHFGFTLIELLVVIAIMGLLLTAAITAMDSARQRARDTKRKADLKQIYTALNLYLNESVSGGRYPNTNGSFYCFHDSSSGLTEALVNNTSLLTAVPQDTLTSQRTNVSSGCYAYRSDGLDLKLMVLLENDDSIMQNDGGATDLRFELFTPVAQSWMP